MFKVNMKDRGDCFGEISLMYNCPRSATVAATTDAVVWVLERETFRQVPAGSPMLFRGLVCAPEAMSSAAGRLRKGVG